MKVEEPGGTELLEGQQVIKRIFAGAHRRALEAGSAPATSRPLLLGITKASLSTESFVSGASFQETTRVLTDAAVQGKVDHLMGLKENVIMGHLIPAGTGLRHYRQIMIDTTDDDLTDEMLGITPEANVDSFAFSPSVFSADPRLSPASSFGTGASQQVGVGTGSEGTAGDGDGKTA